MTDSMTLQDALKVKQGDKIAVNLDGGKMLNATLLTHSLGVVGVGIETVVDIRYSRQGRAVPYNNNPDEVDFLIQGAKRYASYTFFSKV